MTITNEVQPSKTPIVSHDHRQITVLLTFACVSSPGEGKWILGGKRLCPDLGGVPNPPVACRFPWPQPRGRLANFPPPINQEGSAGHS